MEMQAIKELIAKLKTVAENIENGQISTRREIEAALGGDYFCVMENMDRLLNEMKETAHCVPVVKADYMRLLATTVRLEIAVVNVLLNEKQQ